MRTILILPDGETWNTINGCTIVCISDGDFQALCEDKIDAQDAQPLSCIELRETN